jgi:copper chaperone CopZ
MELVHVIDGRARIRVPAIKASERRGRELERCLLTLDGVERAEVNPTTASVVVCFDRQATSLDAILAHLGRNGYVGVANAARGKSGSAPSVAGRVAVAVAHAITESALKRLLLTVL